MSLRMASGKSGAEMSSINQSSWFRVETGIPLHPSDNQDLVRVSTALDPPHSVRKPDDEEYDVWLPQLAPQVALQVMYEQEEIDCHELARRYRRDLSRSPEQCERLRAMACDPGVILVNIAHPTQSCCATALSRHLADLECKRRWSEGLMIGGYVYPIRQEVMRAGGLWFARHKAWMMPNREAWQSIQSQLPGDF